MARTYKTLSLSLPPGIVEELTKIGRRAGRTGARVAAEIVLHQLAETSEAGEKTRSTSWCCQAGVIVLRGPLVLMDEAHAGCREWVPVVVLLCGACRRQLHGREYEGWIHKR